MPTVVNMHHFSRRPPPGAVRIDRKTPLGNPFVLPPNATEAQRAHCLELYEDWLWERLGMGDVAVCRAYDRIEAGSQLACWCAPRPCHGDVIVRVWEREHPHEEQVSLFDDKGP